MRLNGLRVLVTGADGFIGSHLTERLVRLGCRVRAFVFYNSFSSWGWLDRLPQEIHEELEVFPGDIRDPHGVLAAMADCQVVFHLAALIAIPFSYHSPDTYVDTNVKGTLNVLQAARRLDLERIVQTSTSEVYGTARFVPITEDHPLQGQSPYSASKIGADQMALAFHRSFDLPVSVLRPFNTYGPRQSARAVIPTVITQLLAGKRRLELGALTPTRDFSLVHDTAEAFIRIAQCDAAVGQVVNSGSGFEISIQDMAALVADMLGVKAEITLDPTRLRPEASEVDRLLADVTRLRGLTGWSPPHAGLGGFRRGLAETIEWFRQPGSLSLYKPDIYAI